MAWLLEDKGGGDAINCPTISLGMGAAGMIAVPDDVSRVR